MLLKSLYRLLLISCCAVIAIIALLVFFSVSNQPDIDVAWTVSPADIDRAKLILREGSKAKPDEIGTLVLNKADLNLAANYLLNRFTKGRALIDLKPNKLKFVVSAALPSNRLGKFINITFRIGNEDGNPLPTLTKFKTGKLLLPSKLAAWVIESAIRHTTLNSYLILATDSIKAVTIDADKITLVYYPSQASLQTARDFLTHSNTANPDSDIYRHKLTEIIQHHDPKWRLSLAELLQPLFMLAQQRSTLETAIEENRKVIFTVNNYVNQSRTNTAPITPYYPAFVYKRVDLAQHFIAAAAITASVNSQVAEVIGEEKEMQDAISGSGFSFVDLTADRAGMRFGEMATVSPQHALKLQARMAGVKSYMDFMPDPRFLPESMDEATFKKRYGIINSPVFKKISSQIDKLIAQTPLYQP